MIGQEIQKLIDALIAGQLPSDGHERLQGILKADATARQYYRERIDLEAGLRTWAQQQPEPEATRFSSGLANSHWRTIAIAMSIAASIMLVVVYAVRQRTDDPRVDDSGNRLAQHTTLPDIRLVGMIQEQRCLWEVEPRKVDDRISTGQLQLSSGVAKLSLDSGTNLLLEGPCAIDVTSADTAQLLSGNVFVDVTDISNGFVLDTPEASIVDEGTQYAIALGRDAAEVHVYDGSVLWIVDSKERDFQERIESGQARSYQRSDPTKRGIVPFGQRQFVRHLEAELKKRVGDSLLAYDGFENLAGRIRRGRSGLGWNGGWQPAGRSRGRVADVIEAPDDEVFGVARQGRRLLALSPGDDVRRELDLATDPAVGTPLYVSLLVERVASGDESDIGLQISLEPDLIGRARRRNLISFGISSEGFTYVNSGSKVEKSAIHVSEGQVYLIVMKIPADDNALTMRLYQPGEILDSVEPDVWTLECPRSTRTQAMVSVRISSGSSATWNVDELRIGSSWDAITKSGGLGEAREVGNPSE